MGQLLKGSEQEITGQLGKKITIGCTIKTVVSLLPFALGPSQSQDRLTPRMGGMGQGSR